MSITAFGGTVTEPVTVESLLGMPVEPRAPEPIKRAVTTIPNHIEPAPERQTVTPPQAPAKSRRSAVMKPADDAPLAQSVSDLEASLARSFGVQAGPEGYDPDAFIKAVSMMQDRLRAVHADLSSWDAELHKREQALLSAEKAIQAREAKASAALALAGLSAAGDPSRPRQSASWLGRVFR